MAIPRSPSTDEIEIEDDDIQTQPRAEPTTTTFFDPTLFNEFKFLRISRQMLLVCPFDSTSATKETSPSTAAYSVDRTTPFQKGPAFSISACTTPSSSQTTSTSTTPTLGVAHLARSNNGATLGLGDPAVEVGDDAIVWEKLTKKNKWNHWVYSFEVALRPSASGGEGGRRMEERRTFEWRRRKSLHMEMNLVEVGSGKDEGLVLAHYVRSPLRRHLKERGIVAFRKKGGIEGVRWEVMIILTALSLTEMKRRRD